MRALDNYRSVIGLDMQAERAMSKLGHLRRYGPGDLLFARTTPPRYAAMIVTGLVKVTSYQAGTDSKAAGKAETLLSVRGPGDLVREETAFVQAQPDLLGTTAGTHHLLEVAALTAGSARVFPSGRLREFLNEYPAAMWEVTTALCERLAEAERRIGSAAHDSAPRRLARLLCDLERYGEADYDCPVPGTRIPVDLSKAELAAWIGVRRETADRILQGWCTRKIVSSGYRKIIVHDLAALSRIAGVQLSRQAWTAVPPQERRGLGKGLGALIPDPVPARS